MAQQTINIGAAPNDGNGDPIRDAYNKCNQNFSELYTQEVTVNSLSGLPAPSAGEIILPQGRWNINSQITLPDDTSIVPEPGVTIRCDNATIGGLIGNSDSVPTIKADNAGTVNILGGLLVNQLGTAPVIEINNAGGILLLQNLFTTVAGGTILSIGNTAGVALENWVASDGVDGIVITGTVPRTVLNGFNPNGLSGDAIRFSGTTTKFLTINDMVGSCDGFGVRITGAASLNGVTINASEITSGLDTISVAGAITEAMSYNRCRFISLNGDSQNFIGAVIASLIGDTCGFVSLAVGGAAMRTENPSSNNITVSARFSASSFVAPSGTALAGITKKDLIADFNTCPGVSDSVAVGESIMDGVDSLIAITQNVEVPLPATQTTTLQAVSERVSQPASGVLQNDTTLPTTYRIVGSLSAIKAGGTGELFELRLQRDSVGGPFVTFGSSIPFDLTNKEGGLGTSEIVELQPGEKVRPVIVNTQGNDDVTVQVLKLSMTKVG